MIYIFAKEIKDKATFFRAKATNDLQDSQRMFLLFARATKLDGEISKRLENARKKVE